MLFLILGSFLAKRHISGNIALDDIFQGHLSNIISSKVSLYVHWLQVFRKKATQTS